MSKTAVIVLAGIVVILVGVGAWTFAGKSPNPAPVAGSKSGARQRAQAGGAGEGEAAPGSFGAVPGAAGPARALSEEEEHAIKQSLETVNRDANARAVLDEGVEKPWPLSQAKEVYLACLAHAEQAVPSRENHAVEKACICATRAIQRTYPGSPPVRTTRLEQKRTDRAMLDAIEQCALNPQVTP